MKKLSIILGSLIILAIGILIVPSVTAQSTPTTTMPNKATRCDVAQKRLDTRITQATNVKKAHSTVYDNMLAKVDSLITEATTASYTKVADITTAREAVKAKITLYGTKSDAYIKALTDTKNLSCGDSDEAFVTSLTATRAALAEVRSATLDVRSAFRVQVLPALQDYADTINAEVTAEEKN